MPLLLLEQVTCTRRLVLEIQLVLKHCQLAILNLFCVYMVYSISNTNHNKQTRLGLRFILSTQYAYWAYFCHNWHQVDPGL